MVYMAYLYRYLENKKFNNWKTSHPALLDDETLIYLSHIIKRSSTCDHTCLGIYVIINTLFKNP